MIKKEFSDKLIKWRNLKHPERSSVYSSAMSWWKDLNTWEKSQEICFRESSDRAWGCYSKREKEGVIKSKVVGVNGNPHNKHGYTYFIVYVQRKGVDD